MLFNHTHMKVYHWLLLVLTSLAVTSQAATIYTETFTTPATSIGQASGTWRGYNSININGSTYGGMGITTGSAAPTGDSGNHYLYAQNNTPAGATTTVDYFFHTTTATAPAAFDAFTPSEHVSLHATWVQNTGGTVTGMSYYLTAQVAGSWYAASTGGTGYSGSGAFSLDLLNAEWQAVTFIPGTSLSLNTAGPSIHSSVLFASSESITGLGFYIKDLPGANVGPPNDYRTIRFDNLSIVPEPGRSVLFALSLGLMLLRRRRGARSVAAG